jgi:cell division protein FtsL
MRKPLLIIGSLLTIILVLSVVQMSLVNELSTSGTELSKLQARVKEYKLQNEVLKEEYLQLSSFTNIEEKAKTIGFVEAKTQVNLSSPMPIALKQ